MVFDVVVVTASTELQRVVYQHEMETRKQNGVLDELGMFTTSQSIHCSLVFICVNIIKMVGPD